MEKPLLILIMGVVIGVVVWRLLSSPTQRTYGTRMPGQDPSKPYHCVSIRSPKNACEAAKSLIGKRFLSKEAPPLPLTDCTAISCRCRYVHHEDRRMGDEDQRAPFKGAYGKSSERRSGRDRRSHSTA